MNKRLLTDEEIEAIPTTNFGDNTDDLNVAEAQDAKTLKAVGEWLDRVASEGGIVPHILLEALKQGRMPE